MFQGENRVGVLAKAQKLIEKGGFAKAQRLLSNFIESNKSDDLLTLKALNALCYYQLGDQSLALFVAEELLKQHKNQFDEVLPIEIVAFICRTLGCRHTGTIDDFVSMYRSGWYSTRNIHVGEKCASALVTVGKYAEFHEVSLELARSIPNLEKYKMWIVLAKCLQRSNLKVYFIGLMMLWRIISPTGSSKFQNDSEKLGHDKEQKVLRFYIINQVSSAQENELENVVYTLLEETALVKKYSIGWIIATILDGCLDNQGVALLNSPKANKIIVVLCLSLLTQMFLRQGNPSVDPRVNFKYYKALLQMPSEIILDAPCKKLLDLINSYLFESQSEPVSLGWQIGSVIKISEVVNSIEHLDDRTKDMWVLQTNMNIDTEYRKSLEAVRSFVSNQNLGNRWICCADIKPLVSRLICQAMELTEKDCHEALHTLIDTFHEFHDIRFQVLLWISIKDQIVYSQVLIQYLGSTMAHLLTEKNRSPFIEYTLAQAFVLQGQALSALAFIEFCSLGGVFCEILSVYISAKIGLLDVDSHLHRTPESFQLNNIQWDTMGYLFFDSLAKRYYPDFLSKTCATALEFYRMALGGDLLHSSERALEHFEWLMIQQEIPILRQKLTYSFQRLQYAVWHIISCAEEMTLLEGRNHFQKPENVQTVQDLYTIMTRDRERIHWNDDRSILGDCVNYALPERCQVSRYEDLFEIINYVHRVLNSSEFDLLEETDWFGMREINALEEMDGIVKLDKIRRLCFPGIRLIMYALCDMDVKDAALCGRKLKELQTVARAAMDILSESFTNCEQREHFSPLICTVLPNITEAHEYYKDIRTRELYRWKSMLEGRLLEIFALEK